MVVEKAGPELAADDIEGVEVEGRAVLFADRMGPALAHRRTTAIPDHPSSSSGLVEALVSAGAALVGIDSVNIDDTRGGARPAHTGLLEAGIPVVEHLTGLEQPGRPRVPVLRSAAEGGRLGTFPVRAFAIID